jgi:Domain of unknown function (DUF4386)
MPATRNNPATTRSNASSRLVGNRMALAGALLSFMEWIGIVLAPRLPTDALGSDPASIISDYASRPGRTGFLAGWLAIVILGRIVFFVGLKDAARTSPAALRLCDVAVGAAIVGCVIEIVGYGLVATGAWLADADAGASPAGITALDAADTTLFPLILAPTGVAVACGGLAMIVSRPFPRWLSWLGLASGALLALGGLESSASLGTNATLSDAGGMPVPLVWVWLLATGVVLVRAAPRRERRRSATEPRDATV